MECNNISDELKIYELSLIWKEAEYNFAFWESLADSLDWDGAYKTALAAVLKTKNLYEYYMELKKFAALLRDGHTRVWFPDAVTDSPEYSSMLPIMTRLVGGERVITNVRQFAADKVKRWGVIKKVDGLETEEYLEKRVYPYIWHEKKDSSDLSIDYMFCSGSVGSEVELEVDYDGKLERVVLTRTKSDSDWLYDAELKIGESLRPIYQSATYRFAITEDNIAVITIDTMRNNDLPSEFFANFPQLEKARGYIIDIRENGGGNSDNSDAIAGAFIGGEFISLRALHPIHIGAYKAWEAWEDFGNKSYEQIVAERGASDELEKTYKIPRHLYYEEVVSTASSRACPGVLTAPLVVLTSAKTFSAAEDFLVELDYAKRITIVGTASGGSTGNALVVKLESGGGFQLCTRHCTYPDGRDFTNVGIRPHVLSEMSLDDYKNGFDSVLARGLLEIRKMI